MTEVTGKRTFTSKTFQLDERYFLHNAHIGQLHFRDGALKTGEFQDIDTTLNYNVSSKCFPVTLASY